MSTAVRTAIAAAANGVDGINCMPNYRQSTKLGDACVRLEGRRRDASGVGYVDTWQVWVAIPQDVVQAEKWIDDHTAPLTAALEPLLWVTSITPVTLQYDTQKTNGVIFEGTRESD